MIIPSSSFGVIASSRKRIVVASNDVTPNAVNWSNVTYNDTFTQGDITSRQISGINQTITLRANYTSPEGANKVVLTYRVVASGGSDTTWSPSMPGNFSQLTDNDTFTVTNNQYVDFSVFYGASWFGPTATATVTITNVSDSNAVLDTFVLTVTT